MKVAAIVTIVSMVAVVKVVAIGSIFIYHNLVLTLFLDAITTIETIVTTASIATM